MINKFRKIKTKESNNLLLMRNLGNLNFIKRIFVFVGTLLIVNNICGQTHDKKNKKEILKSTIDSIIDTYIVNDKIPGAVILVKEGNDVILSKAYGYAQKYDFSHHLLVEPEKMTTEHLFDIASLTKVIGTTTSIMLLADKGLIKVDDPVSKFIPDFIGENKDAVTIRHLLTHTAGLYEWYPLYFMAKDKKACLNLICSLPLKFPVGQQRRYSDLGFVLLGAIIEKVSGLSLDEFMQINIFKVLGMENTTYLPLKKSKFLKIAATSPGNPYEKRMVYDTTLGFRPKEIDPESWNAWRTYVLKGEVNDGNTWYANEGVSGAAGLFSNAADLQKLIDMLLNKGMVGKKRFISEKTIQSFFTKDKFKNGLGWMLDNENAFMKDGPSGTFGHTGFTGTSISVVPQKKISVILLINRQNNGLMTNGEYFNVNPIRQQVFKAVLRYSN
ncbi:MAG: serine hydrolase domain-containing protein [Bacteroidales bacterium]